MEPAGWGHDPGRPYRTTSKLAVIGWMPAALVFLNDPGGDLLEYVAMLPHEPRPDAGVVPYGDWLARWVREAG